MFKIASEELNEEGKFLSEEVEKYIMRLPWPGNVRQLENTCRWLTVMSPSREIRLEDLPSELITEDAKSARGWTDSLKSWAEVALAKGEVNLLESSLPEFERTMIRAALNKTMGKKKDAALLLGWGRNTLTRKIKELGLEKDYSA